ncbi:MAG: OmpA family protein [Catalinimonas sp.]
MRSIFVAICLVFFAGGGWAQPSLSENKKAVKLYDQALLDAKRRNFDEAVGKLQDALKRDPNFAEAHLQLANIYSVYQEKNRSNFHFKRYVELRPGTKKAREVAYGLGSYAIRQGKYEEARGYFQDFLGGNGGSAEQRGHARQQLAVCDFAAEAMKNPVDIDAKPMGGNVNLFPQQYFPVLTADENILIYTARVGNERQHDENIVVSQRYPDGAWTRPAPISTNINTPRNEGTCSISADAKVIVFTMCSDRVGQGGCDLYISYRTGNVWARPENMGPAINSPHWDTQPSLSADGRQLYFASNRPGGQGKTDVWVARRGDDGEWGRPTNLGASVNTAEEDWAPFIHNNGRTLYFSSDGHPGMGGLDLFMTQLDAGGWQQPKNLGYPLNTHLNENSLFVTADGATAYFSKEDLTSGRQPTSLLYSFAMPEAIQPMLKTGYVSGKVFDADSKEPLQATVELVDLATGEVVQQVNSDPQSGDYLIVLTEGSGYALYVSRKDYLFTSMTFDYREQGAEGVKVDVPLSPLREGMKTRLDNIFFASGEWELLDDSRVELQRIASFLKQNPDLRVEIEGHTDDVGTDAANQRLSEQRARTVREYLTERGVTADRLQSKGYGEAQPVAPNDDDDGRRRNRRIEFRVL